ncbi:hypothetical protein [Microbacterium sp.]|uniref:hypothetical protein n=1 Tax=Microbacterium sp. TaxID=51671 RepID=UPI0025DE3F57|nr:hypothetical protein [Microbacterium sp.]
MKISRLIGAAAILMLSVSMSACAQSNSPVIAPVTMDAGDLQGETVELVVGQVLNINTGDLAVDSYSGEVADTAVAEFVKGYEEGGATFNPGVKALADGSTEVVLSNSDGGIEDVTFTVQVGR